MSRTHYLHVQGAMLSFILVFLMMSPQIHHNFFVAAADIPVPADMRTADLPDSWLVLYNLNDADSITWKDWYIAQWGIPQENTLGLNVATAEHLATSELFNTTIYNPVRSYLENNSELESKIMGILVGYHVPGNFGSPVNSGGGGYSVSSRLQYLDYALSGYSYRKSNPYYMGGQYPPGLTTRFTKSTMQAHRYFAARLDGPNLTAVQALTTKAIAFSSATTPLPANESLYYDYHDPGAPGGDNWTDIRTAVQYFIDPCIYPWLEFESENSPTPNGAMRFSYYRVSGWNTMNWGGTPAGSRIFGFSVDSWGATTVRSTTANGGRFGPNALFRGGFATVFAATDEPYSSGIPKVRPIVESFKLGWTAAEACCYSTVYINWMFELIGDPLLRIPYWFNTTGNNSAPVITNPSPSDNVTGVHRLPMLSVDVSDTNGDAMSLRWYSNSSGPWSVFGANTSVPNGTYQMMNMNFSSDNTKYWWMVNCTDGYNWTVQQYCFTTYMNQSAVLSEAVPANESTGVSIATTALTISISDPEADSFNWTIQTSPFIGNSSGVNDTNGTKTCNVSGLQYATTYYWTVSCFDEGSRQWTNQSFWFTTESEPSNDPPPSGGGSYSPPPEITPPLQPQNNPPSQPLPPTGPTFIERGVTYSYSCVASDQDDDDVRMRFNWGDGTLSNWTEFVASNTSVSVSHMWNDASVYNISVIAQDENGSNSTWSLPLTVTISAPKAADSIPVPRINVSENTSINQQILFDATGSYDPAEVIISYLWEFGDGYTGTGKSCSHTYQHPGSYSVNLTITDTSGKSYTKTTIITILGSVVVSDSQQPVLFYGGIIVLASLGGIILLWIVRRKR